MVMREMCLSRIEELPHTIALELRPTLTLGNPAVLFVDRFRHAVILRLTTVQLRCLWAAAWLTTHRKLVIAALARRFQNVAKWRRVGF